MTTTLEGGEGSASRTGRFLPPGKTRYPLYRRLGGLQSRSGQVRKNSPPPGFDPQTIQPVASRYTNYATRPTCLWLYRGKSSPTCYRVQNWNTNFAATGFEAEYEINPAARWLVTHDTLSIVRKTSPLWRDLSGKLAGQRCAYIWTVLIGVANMWPKLCAL